MNSSVNLKNSPIVQLGRKNQVVLQYGKNQIKKDLPFLKSLVLENECYGFAISKNQDGVVEEVYYPTEAPIESIGRSREGEILICEQEKDVPWTFSKEGQLLRAPSSIYEWSDSALFAKGCELSCPIVISVDKSDHYSCMIMAQGDRKLPGFPGALCGSGNHYGFTIIFSEYGIEKSRKTFPTQNSIDAVGQPDNYPHSELWIYEAGKYHPWRFDYKGNLVDISSYNPLSRKDVLVAGPELTKQSGKN